MNLLESLRVAMRGLGSNKMRTGLTMLGIIIGVGVVILVVAIGQGASARVTEAINSLGTNVLTIWPGHSRVRMTAAVTKSATNSTPPPGTVAPAQSNSVDSSNKLTLEEAQLIAKNFPKTVAAVAPMVRTNVQIKYGGSDSSTNLTGATVDYPYVNNVEVNAGRFFTQQEDDGHQKVCVVGATVADKLTGSPDTNMTGQTISINRIDFKVVGMLTPKGSGAWGQDQDDVIIAPISTVMRRVKNTDHIDTLTIRCTTAAMMPLAQEQISNFLRNRHHLQPPFPDNDDFNIRSQTELMERQQSVTSTMTSLLSAVAIISLVVGGIGIMNIMLVSVTERTREIGIRKAIGATPRDIMMQFLIEASIISLLGGLIGIGMGIGISYLMNSLGWNTIISTSAIFAALIVSAGVGIFFGLYPANKAAGLHPIEALRFE